MAHCIKNKTQKSGLYDFKHIVRPEQPARNIHIRINMK